MQAVASSGPLRCLETPRSTDAGRVRARGLAPTEPLPDEVSVNVPPVCVRFPPRFNVPTAATPERSYVPAVRLKCRATVTIAVLVVLAAR